MKNSMAKNSIYNVIYKAFNVVFPLISAAYVARILSVSGIGKVAAAQNVAQYFVIIAALGLNSYGTRTIAKAFREKDLNTSFSELYLINAISTTICVIAYYYMIFSINFFESEQLLYGVVGLGIVLNYFNVDWFYQGKEEYRYIMLRSIIVKFISLIMLFVFVKNQDDYVVYALINCLATAGNYVYNMFNLKKYVSFSMREISLKRHLKPIFILLASSIAIELYTMLDTTMLNIIQTEIEVGYYTNAVKIIRMASNCIIAIGTVALPRLSYYYVSKNLYDFEQTSKSIFRTLFLFALPASVGVFLLSDTIVLLLFGEAFSNSIITLSILSPLIFVFSIAGGFSSQVIIAKGEEKKYLVSVISGAVINVVLNSFLILHLKHNGAAIASVCAEIVVMSIQCRFSGIKFKEIYTFKEIISLIVANIGMGTCVLIVKGVIDILWIELVASIGCGIIVYFGICICTKNEQVISLKNKGISVLINRFKILK